MFLKLKEMALFCQQLERDFINSWCPHTDSNREPTDYKSVALPIEL